MKRLTILGSFVLAAAVLPAPSAQAIDLPVPVWAQKTTSLLLDPLKIIATAPEGRPLTVVVTRRTADGPSIRSISASSTAVAAQLISSAQDDRDTIAVEMAKPVTMTASGPDPLRPKQWAHDMLRTSTAWKSSTGSGVVVAVVDTGVQASHPDLAGRVLKGHDFVGNDSNADDGNGHGTHVAGIIAANTYNSIGVAGMTKAARILPVRVLDSKGSGLDGNVAAGITWATDHGADVISMSLAGGRSSAETSAVAYAISKGVVVVAAAGNIDKEHPSRCPILGSNPAVYPAAEPGVIGVASINSARAVSSFSLCGNWVDVTAPGEGIWSTYRGSAYAELSGTSMATPYVSATAALAIEEIGTGWTPAGVSQLLTGTATDLGASGWDKDSGYGLINPVAMLSHINTHFSLRLPTVNTIAPGAVPLNGTLLLSDGKPVDGAKVTVSTTLYGSRTTHTLTTNSSGAFSTSFNLPHNVTFAVAYGGSGSTDNASTAISFTHVAPKWDYHYTSTGVSVTNYSIYGQTLALQKWNGSAWKTAASVKVTKANWSATAGTGTWRLLSQANSSLAIRASASWTN